MAGHSVGAVYANASMRKPGQYAAQNLLVGKNVRLVDGKVACISCHTPRSQAEHGDKSKQTAQQIEYGCTSLKALAGYASYDALCMSCHIK